MPISDWSSDVCSSDLGNEAKAIEPANRMALDDHRAVLVDRAQEPAAAGHPADEARVAAIDEALRQAVMQGVREPVLDQIGRAACWECVCQYVAISVVAGLLNKTQT